MNTGNNQKTVFIADDNPKNLKVLSDLLESEGYRTRASLDGVEMLESIKIQKPDLIILDVHMPKADGYEICAILKDSGEFRDIPVIFCSALGETYNIVKGFEVGGVDYITKPFRSHEVLARVKTHIELREKQVSIEEAFNYLKSAQSHLIQSEKMTSIGILVAGIAHEINNPINYIINSLKAFQTDFADLLRLLDFYKEKENLPNCLFTDEVASLKKELEFPILIKEMENLFNGIYTGTMRVHEVVKSLKVFTGSDEETKKEINVRTEIERAVLMIEYKFEESIKLKKDIHPVPDIVQQPGRLSQAVLQLLKNSLDAVHQKMSTCKDETTTETISIELYPNTFKNEQGIVIRISDTGCGMPEDILNYIFDPFYTTKEIGKGVGLGLTICYQIIKDMGGDLKIESRQNMGTTAVITLPVQEKES